MIKLPLDVPGVALDDPDTWTDVHVCESRDHEPRHATRLLHWVTGPIEYCEPCAAQMLAVAKTLGVYVHTEDLPLRTVAMKLSGIKEST